MRDDMTTAAPSAQALRAMMAMAAAAASAAAGDAAQVVLAPTPPPRSRPSSRPNANRRQSINQLQAHLESSPLPKGAPLPSAADGVRSRRIAAVAAEIASKWVHPPESSQYETDVLHQVRAILYMNKSLITQSFVSHVSGVSQGSLSHYVRGLFRGNQQNIEDRLGTFIRKFASGELDTFLEEARSGSRPLRSVIFDSNAAAAASASGTPASITPNTIILPPTVPDPRPPVPPPPPPQLLPAPWTRPPAPPQLQLPRPPSQPATPPRPEALQPRSLEYSPAEMTERARRATQRQMAQRKRTRTPFVAELEESAEPSPVDAVERAYHALVAPNWTSDPTHAEPLLVPIELFVEIDDKTLHMFTQWDVNERTLSPEIVAERIRRARGLSKEFAMPAAKQIRRALFDAGIVCPPPPAAADGENRRLIRIDVELDEGDEKQKLRDEFEWDLGIGSLNSSELFAHCLCSDAGIPQKHASVVARAIREKLVCAHAIAYGDEETRQAALKALPSDDPLINPLPTVVSAFTKDPEQRGLSRDLHEADIADMFVRPLIDTVITEAQTRKEERERKSKEEAERKELDAMRAAEEAEAAARHAKIEEALQEVEDAAIQLQKERGLDFRPYLALKMGRGESPGVWTPGVFDRKRRRQTSFPMTAPSRIYTSHVQTGPRSTRRRRSSRREDETDSHGGNQSEERRASSGSGNRQVKREAGASDSEIKEEVTQTVIDGQDVKVRVVLRIKPEKRKESRSGSSSKKRRRR